MSKTAGTGAEEDIAKGRDKLNNELKKGLGEKKRMLDKAENRLLVKSTAASWHLHISCEYDSQTEYEGRSLGQGNFRLALSTNGRWERKRWVAAQ